MFSKGIRQRCTTAQSVSLWTGNQVHMQGCSVSLYLGLMLWTGILGFPTRSSPRSEDSNQEIKQAHCLSLCRLCINVFWKWKKKKRLKRKDVKTTTLVSLMWNWVKPTGTRLPHNENSGDRQTWGLSFTWWKQIKSKANGQNLRVIFHFPLHICAQELRMNGNCSYFTSHA